MTNNTREISDKLETAEMNLLDARRYLDSGNAINWVADKLRVAINYSMEAWLIKHGHTLNFGNGWHSMKVQFEHAAPEELRLIPFLFQ